MKVREAPATWKGCAQLTAASLGAIATALLRIAAAAEAMAGIESREEPS